ncbi:hypothetical protein D3C75_1268890 [compost metagenome]
MEHHGSEGPQVEQPEGFQHSEGPGRREGDKGGPDAKRRQGMGDAPVIAQIMAVALQADDSIKIGSVRPDHCAKQHSMG